ncbi:MAG TPA: hypothetical protein VHH73_17535, partial [Verrucomicrobiae bacterium]|nr:hypothetical protein [Verrucomicrobiae bacterium]
MTSAESQNALAHLPPELRRKFAELARRMWWLETTRAVSYAVIGVAVSYLILFVSDRLWDTPVWLRVLLTLAGFFSVLTPLSWWLSRWVVRKRTPEEMAVLVQRHHRRLGDTLLGMVELADEQRRPANFSAALYEAAIQQVARQAEPYDFRVAVSTRPARLFATIGGGLLAVIILLLVLLPSAALNAMRRWLAPAAVIARHTLVEIEGLAARQVVPRGEPFEVIGKVNYRSFWHPTAGWARFERQLRLPVEARNNEVRFQVPGQMERGKLRVKVGDVERDVEILPTYRPSLRELAANIEYPEYLQYPAASEKIANGALTAVEGSKVKLEGKADRPLASASLIWEG